MKLGKLNSRQLPVSGPLYDASGGPGPVVLAQGLLGVLLAALPPLPFK